MITRITLQSPRGIGTVIEADFKKETIHIINYTNRILDTAFGVNENPTWDDFQMFLESRCFPRTRDKIKLQLKEIGLDFYDPLSIIDKTDGRMAEDDLWLKVETLEKENESSLILEER